MIAKRWTCARQDRIMRAVDKIKKVFYEIEANDGSDNAPDLVAPRDRLEGLVATVMNAVGAEERIRFERRLQRIGPKP